MAKLTRFAQLLFGSGAGTNTMSKFGGLFASYPSVPTRYSGTTITPALVQNLSNYLTGWTGAAIGGNSPAIEDMNSLCYLFAYQLCYLMQEGIAEYDSTTTYFQGSMVNDGNGIVYVSLTDTNVGNALTSTTNWAFRDGGIPKAANFTASILSGGYICDVSGGTITASLPAASAARGAMLSFKNKSFGSGNVVTIAPNGADNIEGANASVSVAAGQYLRLFCDGTAWWIWNT